MNERIRELYNKADFPKVDIENEAERFAELIVRECAIFSMVATDDHYDVEALYKHFGIES